MRNSDQSFHERRAQECRDLAERSSQPEVGRLYRELAALHAAKFEQPETVAEA